MIIRSLFFVRNLFILIIVSVLASGCLTTKAHKAKVAQEKAMLEKKQKDFDALKAAINEKTLQKGTPIQDIKKIYGEPDDVFSSGSSSSGKVEIWVYGKSISQDQPEDWHPVRLYFNDDKLIDWNY